MNKPALDLHKKNIPASAYNYVALNVNAQKSKEAKS